MIRHISPAHRPERHRTASEPARRCPHANMTHRRHSWRGLHCAETVLDCAARAGAGLTAERRRVGARLACLSQPVWNRSALLCEALRRAMAGGSENWASSTELPSGARLDTRP